MKTPVQQDEQPWDVWYKSTDREIRGKTLSDVGGYAKVGFGVLELPPGSNTRPSHYHSHEEEHLYVLSGTATLHLGNKSFGLMPGSYVCFPAGQQKLHHLVNNSDNPFRYIMVGERIDQDKVVNEQEA